MAARTDEYEYDYDPEKGVAMPTGQAPSQTSLDEPVKPRPAGIKGGAVAAMDFLVKHGVEERGTEPRPENERERLTWFSYFPQFTFWAALNCNILSFSEGMVGPSIFKLDFRATCLVIVLFNAILCIPPAYLATNGPRTGMRQMVQARYAVGYFGAMLPSLANCLTMLGFLALTNILGGQCLSLASGSEMTWTVGIVVVGVIGVCLSFIGLRALHYLSITSLPIIVILYIALIGVIGDKLHLVYSDTVKATTAVTASGVLGYGASQIGFTVSYSSLSSDFTTLLPPNTARVPLFFCVYFGLFTPIVLVQIFGAACRLVAFNIPQWEAAANIGAPNLLYTMSGQGNAAKFVMVLFCLSVIANVAPTIYSCGLSGQIVFPFLTKVPRYFLALIVTAIFLPVAIAGSDHFFEVLHNFLAVLGYWVALYLPSALAEPLLFRAPVSLLTYPPAIWNKPSKLPYGIAFFLSLAVGIPVAAVCMAQDWWTGWAARAIPGGGNIAFEVTFVAVCLVYIPARYLERKYTGK